MNKGACFRFLILSLLFTSCGQELAFKDSAQGTSSQNRESSTDSRGETQVCPAVYEPVCAQPPMPECPSGNFCAQAMPNPKTFSNECERVKAEATFISKGTCPSSGF